VDFLTGEVTVGAPSPKLREAIKLYREALADLCERHGTTVDAFATLTARFGVDAAYGRHFTVTVEDCQGRSSTDRYLGVPGIKLRGHG
jgi:hypothetical protein